MKQAPEARASGGCSWGMLPKKSLKYRGSEMLFTAFSTTYWVKKSMSIKCKITGIFRAWEYIPTKHEPLVNMYRYLTNQIGLFRAYVKHVSSWIFARFVIYQTIVNFKLV